MKQISRIIRERHSDEDVRFLRRRIANRPQRLGAPLANALMKDPCVDEYFSAGKI
jgi:hypothetical protein